MISYEAKITRQMLRDNSDTLFVFGDNLIRRGLGGQAREMRGEPNAVGIPTKRLPSMEPEAFFTDHDFETWREHSAKDWGRLLSHVKRGGRIVIPAAGIGTGLARLEENAPKIAIAIRDGIAVLTKLAAEQDLTAIDNEPSPF
ncbi:hypothetical protein SAMN02744133_108175 [Thalassospira xiamenensis M-5 = DSM 17429]|uniref:DUF7831 domain-containing protein n=1 Tax=Thalassospira xiamenensis M-5 = DSM 17429 TaxID=1123366 RepID=A0AB72UJI5_9PROT|nr:hypothetical protein [Thalassospira xiamenensis]AJD54446.1 hypothetical protein TH3_21868 [Thalassospira xiamenensis M-5 = DSM 17429]SIT22254.1 hypothetical protein SAMN02744133_108175 [Thalassospira xiamenensis M-5 = DSM 17429]